MIDIHTLYGKTPHGQDYPLKAVLRGMERFGIDYALISSLKSAYYSGPESEAEVLAACREIPHSFRWPELTSGATSPRKQPFPG